MKIIRAKRIVMRKKYVTRDGGRVVLYTTRSPCPIYPVVGVTCRGKLWVAQTWSLDGSFNNSVHFHPLDLFEVVEE